MKSFNFKRAMSAEAALRILETQPNARLLGGGTNLIDLMREGIEEPDCVIDVQRSGLTNIEMLPDGGLRIGAAARNSDIANHPLIRDRHPLLSKALLSGASPQLRNMATAAGNLMQRTRCYYFMDPAFPVCNKRQPGSGCSAREGDHRIHAIFGGSDACIAVHPSDMCVALAALDAIVQIRSPQGPRSVSIRDFHRLPGRTPHIDTNLATNEMIVSIDLPESRWAKRVDYLKVRDRQSFAFALVSCAAALEVEDGSIHDARLAFGGVAPKPWRAFEAERFLVGKPANPDTFRDAAGLVIAGAAPLVGNAWKVPLMRRIAERALRSAGGPI